MSHTQFVVAIASLLMAAAVADAQDAQLPSGEAVLMKYVEATGGKDAYRAIKSSRSTGTVAVPAQGLNGALEVVTVSPNKVASKVTIAGMGEQKHVYNGEHCWEESTMMGARLVTGVEAGHMIRQGDLELVYNPKKHFKVIENKGIVEVDGEKCYKIALVTTDDQESTNFYSVQTGLQRKSAAEMHTPMGALQIESFLSDYKKFNGISLPTKVEQKFGNGMVQTITIEQLEHNVDVPAAVFAVPESIQKMIDQARKKDKAPLSN